MHHTKSGMATISRIVAFLALSCVVLQTSTKSHPLLEQCRISKYRNMQPSRMSAARELQDLQHRRPSCHRGLLLKNFKNCDIRGKERLMLTLRRLSLVVNVLENMNQTQLVTRNLEVFTILQADLRNCEMAESPKLKKCRHHLNQYRDMVTRECLENDVLRSLVWILTEDLGYLIYGEQSTEKMETMVLPVTDKSPATRENKDKKKKRKKSQKNDD